MRVEVDINPSIIPWAVTRAGFRMEEIASKVPNLWDWAVGNKKPTVRQLEEFSRRVYLPFGFFFLPAPPKEDLPIPFYRTQYQRAEPVSINIRDTILLLEQRQEWLREYLRDGESEELSFVGKFDLEDNELEIVEDIRRTLKIGNNWANSQRSWQAALDHLTEHIEDAGIVTVYNSVVGNNTHRPIEVDECRGLVLVDKIAPFIFVNSADSKAAQMFTIGHELAHIWIGRSAGFDFRKLEPASDPTEQFCDRVAAEFLVPRATFRDVWRSNQNFTQSARFFKVSEIVIARRALDLNFISRDSFFEFYDQYIQRDIQRKQSQGGGGDFYSVTKKRLGVVFSTHIRNATKTGKLLYRDAYRLTGLKGDTFQTFFEKHY